PEPSSAVAAAAMLLELAAAIGIVQPLAVFLRRLVPRLAAAAQRAGEVGRALVVKGAAALLAVGRHLDQQIVDDVLDVPGLVGRVRVAHGAVGPGLLAGQCAGARPEDALRAEVFALLLGDVLARREIVAPAEMPVAGAGDDRAADVAVLPQIDPRLGDRVRGL